MAHFQYHESVSQWRSQNGIILKNLEKNMPRIASEIGASLKGKNLLPEGANFFLLRAAPIIKKKKYLC